MSLVYRVYVQKRNEFAVEAMEIYNNLKEQLKIESLNKLDVVYRYDIQGVSKEAFDQGVNIPGGLFPGPSLLQRQQKNSGGLSSCLWRSGGQRSGQGGAEL